MHSEDSKKSKIEKNSFWNSESPRGSHNLSYKLSLTSNLGKRAGPSQAVFITSYHMALYSNNIHNPSFLT